MGRQRRKGLSYFPFDVDFFTDKKIRAVKSQFGADGIVLYQYLLCEIYRMEGYYLYFDDDMLYIIADDLNMSTEKIGLMLSFFLGRSLFNDTLFKADKILTSKGIQERFQEAVKSRGSKNPIPVIEKFWVLSKEDTLSFIKVHQNADFSEKNNDNSKKNKYNSENYDTKESKVNKSKVKESIRACAEFYEQTFRSPLSGALSSEIAFRISTGTDERLVMEALKKCYGKKQPAPYFAKIMENLCAEGIITYQDYCKSNNRMASQLFMQNKANGMEGLEEL